MADSIKLLPWCISSAVSIYYMGGTMATAVQQDEDIPSASEPKGSPAPGPSSSPAHPPRTPPLPVPPLPDNTFIGTPLVRHPFTEFLAISTQKCETTLPVVHSMIITTRGPMSPPKSSKLGVNTALHRVMKTYLNWYWELGPALNNKSRKLLALPSSPTRATADPDDGTVTGSLKSTGDQSSSDSDSSREDVVNSICMDVSHSVW